MNLPNKLATLRMILIIPFVFLLEIALGTSNTALSITLRILACIIFVGASITDYYDGQIARKYNLVTNLGKLIDPLADKLLVISALVVLAKYNQISLWIVLIIIFRELLITGLRAISANEPPQILAWDEEPFDSVISETSLTVYGNSSCEGITYFNALSARFPCPSSLLPGALINPASPTEYGGKL